MRIILQPDWHLIAVATAMWQLLLIEPRSRSKKSTTFLDRSVSVLSMPSQHWRSQPKVTLMDATFSVASWMHFALKANSGILSRCRHGKACRVLCCTLLTAKKSASRYSRSRRKYLDLTFAECKTTLIVNLEICVMDICAIWTRKASTLPLSTVM